MYRATTPGISQEITSSARLNDAKTTSGVDNATRSDDATAIHYTKAHKSRSAMIISFTYGRDILVTVGL